MLNSLYNLKKHETNILQRCSIQKCSIFPVDEADKQNKVTENEFL